MIYALVLAAWASTPQALPVMRLAVGDHVISVEVADDNDERATGLMYRESLPADSGMLFVYPQEAGRSFWMKDTLVPLSIAFIDAQGRIVQISQMQPLDLTSTRSRRPAMYALEMPQGWFSSHGVEVGHEIAGLPGPSAE